jgi:protein-L-isoaspartate O-methyltransferase
VNLSRASTPQPGGTVRDASGSARTLVSELTASGHLSDPLWRQAFLSVPRHVFLPWFYRATRTGWQRIDEESSGREAWVHLAYQDVTWVTRLSGPGSAHEEPASSCIQPSLAARMLAAVDVGKASHVLEVGTGTGYMTGLLCRRLGQDRVTSIDIDSSLIDDAACHLATLGYRPALAVADGNDGHPDRALYDRLLATAAVDHIPAMWLAQTRPGGKILAPVRTALALLEVQSGDCASGRFLPRPAHILPLRRLDAMPVRAGSPGGQTADRETPSRQPATVLRDEDFRFFLALALPEVDFQDDGMLGPMTLRDAGGSTARIGPLGDVQQRGQRRLWSEVEDLHAQWEELGRPRREHFGLTVTPQAQTAWLRMGGEGRSWELHATQGAGCQHCSGG